jgi:hypothetical protein
MASYAMIRELSFRCHILKYKVALATMSSRVREVGYKSAKSAVCIARWQFLTLTGALLTSELICSGLRVVILI